MRIVKKLYYMRRVLRQNGEEQKVKKGRNKRMKSKNLNRKRRMAAAVFCLALAMGMTGCVKTTEKREAEEREVYAAIPKFEKDYGAELANSLKALGMTDAFDMERADLSGFGVSKQSRMRMVGCEISSETPIPVAGCAKSSSEASG